MEVLSSRIVNLASDPISVHRMSVVLACFQHLPSTRLCIADLYLLAAMFWGASDGMREESYLKCNKVLKLRFRSERNLILNPEMKFLLSAD